MRQVVIAAPHLATFWLGPLSAPTLSAKTLNSKPPDERLALCLSAPFTKLGDGVLLHLNMLTRTQWIPNG